MSRPGIPKVKGSGRDDYGDLLDVALRARRTMIEVQVDQIIEAGKRRGRAWRKKYGKLTEKKLIQMGEIPNPKRGG